MTQVQVGLLNCREVIGNTVLSLPPEPRKTGFYHFGNMLGSRDPVVSTIELCVEKVIVVARIHRQPLQEQSFALSVRSAHDRAHSVLVARSNEQIAQEFLKSESV